MQAPHRPSALAFALSLAAAWGEPPQGLPRRPAPAASPKSKGHGTTRKAARSRQRASRRINRRR